MAYVLGIDGGGSKTMAAVSGAPDLPVPGRLGMSGASVFTFNTARGCNFNSVSRESGQAALEEAVRGALASAQVTPSEISSVCAGVAGGASPEVAAMVSEILSQLLPCASIRVVGDNVIAFEAAFDGSAGVVCISGTGSVAFGRNERGEMTRAGGWGRLVSDEGSGHWIGRQAIAQCLNAMDQGRSSRLITETMEHWGIVTREQLVARCHSDPIPNFAELFPVVLRVANEGDPMATEILDSAALKLARITQIVLRRLWSGRSVQRVAIIGSVFANAERIRHAFANLIRADRPEVQVRLCERQPVEGALQLAWQNIGESGLAAS
jgi:N-acetylglucosamine kinase-like BadF-type ATPase